MVDKDHKYCGVILLNDIREIMFDTSRYSTTKVKDIMIKAPATINIDDRMNDVMKKFEKTNAWNLPVVDRYNRYRGLISKSNIISVYRKELIVQTE